MSKCKFALSEQDAIHSNGIGFVVCMKYIIKHCPVFLGHPVFIFYLSQQVFSEPDSAVYQQWKQRGSYKQGRGLE